MYRQNINLHFMLIPLVSRNTLTILFTITDKIVEKRNNIPSYLNSNIRSVI